jgi:hypothetical protein
MDAAARDTELLRDRGGTQLGAQLLDLLRIPTKPPGYTERIPRTVPI